MTRGERSVLILRERKGGTKSEKKQEKKDDALDTRTTSERTILQRPLQQDFLGSSSGSGILGDVNILPLNLEDLGVLNEEGLQPREGGGGRSRDEGGRVG